jgi:TolB protein
MVFSLGSDIYKIDADGTDEKQLTTSERNDAVPAFSPDKSKIVFQSAPRDGDFDLYVMDSDGTDVAPLTDDAAQEFFPDWRPVQ